MAPPRNVICDSDDDSDRLSAPNSPRVVAAAAAGEDAPGLSTSTDPSFFRDVYEEQQRALSALRHAAAGGQSRDLWDVPSSGEVVEAADRRRHDSIKRKRAAEELLQDGGSVVIELDDGNTEDAVAAKTKRPRLAGGLGISIPLEPITPGRIRECPALLGSSGTGGAADLSLPGYGTAQAGQQAHDPPPTEVFLTESTVAYTTPSLYASSGRRRALGSSGGNGNKHGENGKSVVVCIDGGEPKSEAAEAPMEAAATPARRGRQHAAEMVQLMSSPDIIAEPVHEHRRLRIPPKKHESPEPRQQEDDDEDTWEPKKEARKAGGRKGTDARRRRRQRQASGDDELSAPAEGEQDEEDGADDNGRAVSAEESDASTRVVKSKAKAKGRQGRPKRNPSQKAASMPAATEVPVLSIELELPEQAQATTQSKAKRPRGRPKRERPQPLGDPVEAKEEQTITKASTEDTDIKLDPRADDGKGATLSETSGNKGASAEAEKEDEASKDGVKQSTATARSAGLGMGLSTSQGRVAYRVGLSKKFRIAPLLKSLRK